MTRVALINPDMAPVWEVIDTDSLRKPEYRPPIGLMMIGAVLQDHGHDVRLWDNYLDELPASEVVSQVAEWQPDVCGLSALTTSYPQAREMIALLRAALPEAFIGLGGHHPTLMGLEVVRENTGLDAIFVGEGEATFLEAIGKWEAGAPLEGMGGVGTRRTLSLVAPTPIKDLDSLPMPAWDLVDPRRYDRRGSNLDVEPVFIVLSSRGCSYGCGFCGMPEWNKRYRTRSAKVVADEIDHLVSTYGAKGIYFREDNFTLQPRHVREFCEEMISRDVPVLWECESRVDTLDLEMLQLMYDAGCRGIWCGVESGSQKTLDSIRKGTKVEDALRFYDLCRQVGIETGALFMLGLPGETESDVWESYHHALEIRPSKWVGFQAYVAIPKCALYDRVVAEGLFVTEWNGIYEVETAELSRDRIRELERELNAKYAEESGTGDVIRHRDSPGAIPNYGSET